MRKRPATGIAKPDSKAISVRLPRDVFEAGLRAKTELEREQRRLVSFSEVVVSALATQFLGQAKASQTNPLTEPRP